MNWEKDLIKYRREKAEETLEVARILLKGKQWFKKAERYIKVIEDYIKKS